MSEFVGRTGSNRVYSYPETPRSGIALTLFARNFATGPKASQAIGAGINVPWNAIDVTAQKFTIAAGGTTVSIAGDQTGSYLNADTVTLTPTAPVAGAPVTKTITSAPTFAAGLTTFSIDSAIDATTTAGTISDNSNTNVPITPKSTGVVLISGVVTAINSSGASVNVTATVHVNGDAVPAGTFSSATVPDGGFAAIPFEVEALIPIGATQNIQVFMDGAGAFVEGDGSAINVQEVPVSSG
jgi:hypothetical protein